MFVGREEELGALERLYRKSGFQMVVLYGRRRVGKTTLLDKFSEGKPTLYFTAQVQSATTVSYTHLTLPTILRV